jgi:signal transduction histidine kinase
MNLNIKTKSTFMLLVAFIMAPLVGGYAVYQLSVVNKEAADIRENWLPALKDLGEIKFLITRIRSFASHLLITKDTSQITKFNKINDDLFIELAHVSEHYKHTIDDNSELKLWETFIVAWRTYLIAQNTLLAQADKADHGKSVDAFDSETAGRFDEALAALDADIEFNRRGSVASIIRAEKTYQNSIWVTSSVVALVLLFVLLAGSMVSRGVISPLLRITNALKGLAEGDLETAIPFPNRRDEIGGMAGQLHVFKDALVARKKAEDEVLKLNQELEERVARRTAALEQANAELEAFAYSVSHDLRIPLRAIEGFSAILLEEHAEGMNEEGRRCLATIRRGAVRLAKFIDDLLDYSSLLRQTVRLNVVNMNHLTQAVLGELLDKTPERNISLHLGDLPPTLCDRDMMYKVLTNLLGNAIRFTSTRAEAQIEFTGAEEGGEIVYVVKDNGVGFDMRYAHKLFGIFQRLHGLDEFEGTGIGLAIVKRIIDLHGGRVWAEAKVGEGAVVHFALPRMEKDHA